MVNYARMEEVWRSYGPLEPVGPEQARRQSRRRTAGIVGGVLAVCALGAGAGLYLQPDLQNRGDGKVAETAKPDGAHEDQARQAGPVAASASLSEAEALEAQLQRAVVDGAGPPPVSTAPSSGAAPYSMGGEQGRSFGTPSQGGPARVQPRAASVRPRVAAPGGRQAAPGEIRPAESAWPAPVPDRPLVTASAAPPLRTFPSEAPVFRPAPRITSPAPTVVSAPRPLPLPPSAPDCARAGSNADRMVCESPDLAALDRRLEVELAGAMAAGHSRGLLLRDQADWRARRDAAAPDPRAVADAYRRRIGQLQSMQ